MNLNIRLPSLVEKRFIRVSVLVILMLISVMFILTATHLGPGISPDSTVYASTARSFAATGDFINFYGKPLTMFPPGLPLVLGVILKFGTSLPIAVVALNCVSAALSVLLTYFLAQLVFRSFSVSLVAAALVCVSTSLIRVDSMLWSEPLFSVVVLMMLYSIVKGLNRGELSWVAAAGIGILGALAFSLRYIGVIAIIAAVVGVFLANARVSFSTRMVRTCITIGVAGGGAVVIIMRNLNLGVSTLGDRVPGTTTVGAVLHDSALTLGNYVIAPGMLAAKYSIAVVMLGALITALLGFGTYRCIRNRSTPMMFMSGFIIAYWILLMFSELTTDLDPISQRFTAPIFVPMLILAMYAIDQIFMLTCLETKHQSTGAVRTLVAAVVVILATCGVTSLYQDMKWASNSARDGIEINSQENLASPLARRVSTITPGAVVATTNPWLVSWVSGHAPLRAIPLGSSHESPSQIQQSVDEFIARIGNDHITYLAYFNADFTQVTPLDLGSHGVKLVDAGEFKDGRLFKVSS
jgi:Dolichyl-phosphate-mannose-protein mannosyltransferase